MIRTSLVTVIIPTKGRVELLGETLRSVVSQTHRAWEALVVDDGSTDTERREIALLAGMDSRIRPIPREGTRSGASVCRNQGLAHSRGEFALFLDSDDLLGPTCLEGRMRALTDDPRLDFVVFGAAMFSRHPGDSDRFWNTLVTDTPDLDRFLRRDPPWATLSPLWRRTSLARVGAWDELAPSWQDWEFHVRALAADLKYRKTAVTDCHIRNHEHPRISTRPLTEDTVVSVLELFARTCGRIAHEPAWTERRRHMLACQVFRMALPRHHARPRKPGVRLLRLAHARGLLSRKEYLFSRLVCAVGGLPKTRRALLFLEDRVFPEMRRAEIARNHLTATRLQDRPGSESSGVTS